MVSFQIKKAIEALKHPGINSQLMGLARNAIPYFLSPRMNVAPPLTIYWSINSVCDLHCKMCDVGMFNEEGTFYKTLRIDRKLHEIDIDVFKRVVDEVAPAKPYMAINSTEPMLYRPLPEAVEYCTRNNLECGVTTGAYRLTKIADELAEARLTRLVISVDGPPEIHNHIRGREDSFQQSMAGLEKFYNRAQQLNHTPEIYLSYVTTNMNYHALVDFYNAVKDLPVTQINFTYMWFISPSIARDHNAAFGDMFPVSESCFNEHTSPDRVDVEVLHDQIQQLRGKPKVVFLPDYDRDKLNQYFHDSDRFMVDKPKCMASWFFLQILADGKAVVYTRCHLEPVGNINEQSFYEIWNGKKMKDWRKHIRKVGVMPMCRRCDLAY